MVRLILLDLNKKASPLSGEAVVDYESVSSPLISRVSSRDEPKLLDLDSYPLELAPFRYPRYAMMSVRFMV
ncbi:hypothetical protein ABD77_28130 [Brevibacillus formosus]|nr:hypothetical protein [Brevibacillus formosus]